MKVANKRPLEQKSPVRITSTKYELWYSKPRLLGVIEKKGKSWYTADGMRFISSRDALEYLIRISDTPMTVLPGTLPKVISPEKIMQQIAAEKDKRATLRRTRVGPTKEQIAQAVTTTSSKDHPLFQKFLEFVEFTNRRTSGQGGN